MVARPQIHGGDSEFKVVRLKKGSSVMLDGKKEVLSLVFIHEEKHVACLNV